MSDLFKGILKYIGWIFFFVSLWFKGCSEPDNESVQRQEVIVPKKEAAFTSKKPNHELLLPKKNSEKSRNSIVDKKLILTKELIELNKKNKESIEFFEKANDSLKKEIYKNSIVFNNFSTTFEDDNITLNINGIVKGEVQEITPSYVIKEKKISVEVNPKKTVFRLLAGIEVGNSINVDNFSAKANLIFQNRNGNIISASIDTNNTIWVGYNISIFNVKR